jgi:hypothetical protein
MRIGYIKSMGEEYVGEDFFNKTGKELFEVLAAGNRVSFIVLMGRKKSENPLRTCILYAIIKL